MSFSRLRILGLAALLCVLSAMSGCGFITFARVTVNDPISLEDVAFIVPGETTFSEIITRLGAPNDLAASDVGAVASYHFLDVRYSRINLAWPAQIWSSLIPDFIMSATGLGTDVFQVIFDRRWVAQHHAFAHHLPGRRFTPWPFGSSGHE